MGFSVSGSAVIVFIGVMVAAGIAVPSMVGSFGSLTGAHGNQVDRGVDALNTGISIETATYDGEPDEFTIDLKNVGSTTLGVEETSVLVDGTIPPSSDVTTDVEGDQTAGLWLPGDTLTVTVERVDTEPDRAKIVAENGIAETASGSEIVIL
ncbi:MAG: flagellin [Halobacteriota archaeon]|uniref:flagellin n=1 Tax=Natronomonas sp. TaxID=2184060 RepID=UPI003974CDCF